MSVIDEYLAGLDGVEKKILAHMYNVVRQFVPETTEELSYSLPAFKYKNKSLIAIVANKNFMSLYPFGSVEKLGIDLDGFEYTSGSIHFTKKNLISDKLLKEILQKRIGQIEAN